MAEIKTTKKDILTVVKAMAEAQVPDINLGEDLVDAEVTAADIVAYCDTTIAQLEAKKEKAAETRAKKAAQADALKDVILSLVTNEPQTRDEIFVKFQANEEIADPEVTISKIGSRLTKLVAENSIIKEPIKVKNSEGKMTSKMGYKLA